MAEKPTETFLTMVLMIDTIGTMIMTPSNRTAGQAGFPVSWEETIEDFLREGARSEHTCRAYRRHLQTFREFCQSQEVAQPPLSTLSAYKSKLKAAGVSLPVQAQAISAIRAFILWAREARSLDLPGTDELNRVFKPPRVRRQSSHEILEVAERAALLDAVSDLRDRAILALLLEAGIRVSELVTLRFEDLIFQSQYPGAGPPTRPLRLRITGTRNREIRLDDSIGKTMQAFLVQVFLETGSWRARDHLFQARDRDASRRVKTGLTERAVEKFVLRTMKKAGIAGKQVSCLRHTFAIHFLLKGGSVNDLHKHLGNASLATTQPYLEQSRGQPWETRVYVQIDEFEEIAERLVTKMEGGDGGDDRIVLFVCLNEDCDLDERLLERLKRRMQSIRPEPNCVVRVTDFPRTPEGEIAAVEVGKAIHGRPVRNVEALANPEALEEFRDHPELAS